jgi:hypothetical protein
MALLPIPIKNCLVALALIVGTVAPGTAAEFSIRRGIALNTWTTWPDENQWSDPDVILPFPEWRRHVTARDLSELRAGGFDFVRIPVDPSVFLSSETGNLRGELMASVLESVRLVNRAGLKAVVDLHLLPAGANRRIGTVQVMDDPALFDRYLDLVRSMAHALSHEDPALVALEPMNEPDVDCTADAAPRWPGMLRRLYAAARASATRTTLILSGGCQSGADGLAVIDPDAIADDNVIWTFHTYAPFLLTHQGATWAGDFIEHVRGLPYPQDAVSEREREEILDDIRARIGANAPLLRRRSLISYLGELYREIDTPEKLGAEMFGPLDTVSDWARRHGIDPGRIFVGEFGMIRQEYGSDYVMPAEWRAAYITDMIAAIESRGFSWSLWSYGGAFGLFEGFGGEKLPGTALKAIRMPE